MSAIIKRRPSAAGVLAAIAIFVALGSGAALALPGKSTVDKNDIQKAAVQSKHVKDGSLLARDFKAGQLPAGSRGPQGELGPPGPQGPAGPTAAGVQDDADPAPTPDLPDADVTNINTPTAGRLLVMYSASTIQVDCSAGDHPDIGLYVDGVPVPDTQRDLLDNVQSPANASGITAAAVSAGNHTIEAGVDCPGGSPTSTSFGPGGRALTGILIGG